MILNEEILIKVNSAQLKHLKNKGLNVSIGDEINIPVNYLSDGSNIKIDCLCDVCGKQNKMVYRRYLRSMSNGGYYSCSPKCAQNKVKETFIENYGHNHHFKSESTKNKIKETFKRNYGTEHFSHSQKYRDNCDEIKNKRITTINDSYKESENIISISGGTFTKYCENHLGEYVIDRGLYSNRKINGIDTCTICFPKSENNSIKEKELLTYITKNYDGEVLPNHRIGNRELDIYIPKLNLGFEFNGLYWHNELSKSNHYHLDKTEFFEEKDIKLIHIYEDDWFSKNLIIKSRISNLLGKSNRIYAKNCEIKELSPKESNIFLTENHIQGSVNGKIKIGLFYLGELVSIMTFGGLRKSLGNKTKDGEWELLRFCNKLGVTIVGGASKLFKFFVKTFTPLNVISYADRSWSNGDLYYKLGFQLSHKTKPNYYYIVNKERQNRYNFRKDKLIKEGYDPSLSEHKIMLNRKIYRIYDSGSLLFRFTP